VGKTFAMLNEGWRRSQRGTDVVVGFVETHGRAGTAAQQRDLEIVARRRLEYRGQSFEEMDVDAVLSRRPAVALVDELAHSNVPGSRNAKRWQDVEELLDAGIDVVSTVNIQHLESLNDVVEEITGVTQRETVPDAVVRAADQVELVDMTPEALRRRMAHGSIYPPERVDTALANYFRPGNLGALRELALLWVADKVDESLHDYRHRHGIAQPWETRERIVVALTGAPGGDDLIRRAARMANRAHAELLGVHIRRDDGLVGPTSDPLSHQRQLLKDLGGTYRELGGPAVATALVQVARAENATQLVLGASQHSRWSELVRGSVVNTVLREAGGTLDVLVVSPDIEKHNPAHGSAVRYPRLSRLSRRRTISGLSVAVVGLPLLTAALAGFRDRLNLTSEALLYLLVVVASAAVGGVWAATVAAVGGSVLLNWYFTPPIHTWTIGDPQNVLALLAFVVVAGVVSGLVDLAARRSTDAHHARAKARELAQVAGSLLREEDPLPELVDRLQSTFGLEGVSVLTSGPDGWRLDAAAGAHPPTAPDGDTLTLPLAADSCLAVLSDHLLAEDRQVLNAFAAQLSLALQSRLLRSEAAGAAALAKTNELRTALLAAVSHDLRTPLAAIKASASSLLSPDVSWDPDAVRTLLETIDTEADRLNSLVGNLLDMSRIQTGAFVVKCEPVALEEVVASALVGIGAPGVKVSVDVAETLPPVVADHALLERAVANLVDNAVRHSREGGEVRVEAGAVAGRVDLRVVDNGPGIPQADRARVFQPFQRLNDGVAGVGVGLGLAVAKGFVEAIGGELSVDDTPGGGCTMVVSLQAEPAGAPGAVSAPEPGGP